MIQAPGDKTYDVAVVGGGIVGLACAWASARRGMSAVLLERDRAGSGSSGVAAGMLAPVTEAEFGERNLLELNLRGAERWPSFARELLDASGIDCGFRVPGALVVATDRDDAEELRRLAALHESLGLASSWLRPRQARALEPGLSPRVRGAIRAPDEACVDPAAAVAALAAACVRAGVEVRTGVEVGEVCVRDGAVTGVRTATERVRAQTVVVAAGAWSEPLAPEAPPLRPVKGQIATLRAGQPPSAPAHILRSPRCYLLAREDGRVLLGATMEERGFDRTVTADAAFGLLEAARELLPDVGELEWVGIVAGLRPATPDNLPAIGRGAADGLVWAAGHHRNGVLLAPLTGDIVAGLLADGADPPPSTDPARFAGAEAVA